MSSSSSNQSHQPTWTEPPWCGWVETTGDALLILEAARQGLIPRVTRRLVDSERKMISSGSVFVFDENESGIKRWTDGFFWSPSRILGNFLLYRETDKRGAGHRGGRSDASGADDRSFSAEGSRPHESTSLSRPKGEGVIGVDKQRERSLMGSLTNTYKFKPDGLMKKTFSLTINGVAQHLISYYKVEDVENGRLRSPSSLPELASLDISPEYLDKTHFRNPPKVEIGLDGNPRYRGEADDIENSPSISRLTGLVAESAHPAAAPGQKPPRFEPYSKPRRRNTKSQPNDPPSLSAASANETPSPPATSTTTPVIGASNPGYPQDPGTSNTQTVAPTASPHYPPYAMPGLYPLPPHPYMATPHIYPPPPNTYLPQQPGMSVVTAGGPPNPPPPGALVPYVNVGNPTTGYPAYMQQGTTADPTGSQQINQAVYPYYAHPAYSAYPAPGGAHAWSYPAAPAGYLPAHTAYAQPVGHPSMIPYHHPHAQVAMMHSHAVQPGGQGGASGVANSNNLSDGAATTGGPNSEGGGGATNEPADQPSSGPGSS